MRSYQDICDQATEMAQGRTAAEITAIMRTIQSGAPVIDEKHPRPPKLGANYETEFPDLGHRAMNGDTINLLFCLRMERQAREESEKRSSK